MAWPWAGRAPSPGHPTHSHCSESPTPGRPSTYPQEMGTFRPGPKHGSKAATQATERTQSPTAGGWGPRRPRAPSCRTRAPVVPGPPALPWECPAREDLDPRQHTRGAHRLRVSETSPVRRRQSVWCPRTRADLGQDPVPSFCKSGSRCRSEAPGRGVLSARPYGGHKYLQSPALGLREAVRPGLRSAAMPGRMRIPRQPGDERRQWEAATSPWALPTTGDRGPSRPAGAGSADPASRQEPSPCLRAQLRREVAREEGGRSARTPDAPLPAACGAGLLGSRAPTNRAAGGGRREERAGAAPAQRPSPLGPTPR